MSSSNLSAVEKCEKRRGHFCSFHKHDFASIQLRCVTSDVRRTTNTQAIVEMRRGGFRVIFTTSTLYPGHVISIPGTKANTRTNNMCCRK